MNLYKVVIENKDTTKIAFFSNAFYQLVNALNDPQIARVYLYDNDSKLLACYESGNFPKTFADTTLIDILYHIGN